MCTARTVLALLCISPYQRGAAEFGCGQCIPCRINYRRMWVGRIGLEVACHPRPSSFVTLTYGDESVPESGSLSAAHWRAFSKGIGCRYFGVGEYGSLFGRPHYHAILAGIPPGEALQLVSQRWRLGFVSVSDYSRERAQYVASYVVKKWTKPRDELGERLPEFARMSRRPGIGVPGLAWLAQWLVTAEGAKFIARTKDVPHSVRVDGAIYPLGETCVRYLRLEAGMPEKDPARLRNHELRAQVRADEFPDLDALRESRRVGGYDRAARAARRVPSGASL